MVIRDPTFKEYEEVWVKFDGQWYPAKIENLLYNPTVDLWLYQATEFGMWFEEENIKARKTTVSSDDPTVPDLTEDKN